MIAQTKVDYSKIQPIVALRFDGASANIYKYMMPLLAEYGIPASLCTGASWIDYNNPGYNAPTEHTYKESLGEGKMTPLEVKSLLDNNWELIYYGGGEGEDSAPTYETTTYLTAGGVKTASDTNWGTLRDMCLLMAEVDIGAKPTHMVYPQLHMYKRLIPQLLEAGFVAGSYTGTPSDFKNDGPALGDAVTFNQSWLSLLRLHDDPVTVKWAGMGIEPTEDNIKIFPQVIAAKKAVTSLIFHMKDNIQDGVNRNETTGALQYFDDDTADSLVAMWRRWIEYLIEHDTVFLKLSDYHDYITNPVNPHLALPWRDLWADKWECIRPDNNHVMFNTNSGTTADIVTDATCPSGYPVLKTMTNNRHQALYTVKNRWYLMRMWVKDGSGAPRFLLPGYQSNSSIEIKNSTLAISGATTWKQIAVWLNASDSMVGWWDIYFSALSSAYFYASKPEMIELPEGYRSGQAVTLPDGTSYTVGTNVV